ncbi:hypothetical protein GGP41_001369 [Bipolaris sorokiniana]|uniref:Uncharacterized protein n=1 Tax=Cochliobolus sativus TaxID=45130 RepID=A0A8H5Z6P1_COCSA|nr:hypothetical protein GGP41_001369 [Bipolaris sorokiniana]
MDETGVALGVCTNTRVLTSSSKKKAYVKFLEDREWLLDLAPFCVPKSRYRALDDAVPIKKERFVVSYNRARIEAY